MSPLKSLMELETHGRIKKKKCYWLNCGLVYKKRHKDQNKILIKIVRNVSNNSYFVGVCDKYVLLIKIEFKMG